MKVWLNWVKLAPLVKLFINPLTLLLLSSLMLAEHAPAQTVPGGPPTGLPPLPPEPMPKPTPEPMPAPRPEPDFPLPTNPWPTPTTPDALPSGPLNPQQPEDLLTIATLQGHLPPLAPAVVDLAIISSMLPEVGFPQGGTFANPSPTPGTIPAPQPPGEADVVISEPGPDVIAQAGLDDNATPQGCHAQLGQIQATTASQRTSGAYESLIGCYESALETTLTIENTKEQNTVLNDLAIAHYIVGNYRRAIEYHEQQRDLARTSGDATQEGIALSGLGSAYGALGNYDQAIEYYTQGLGLIDPLFANQWHTLTLRNLGNAYYAKKDFSRALQYQESALQLSLQSGDRYGEMQALGNLGNIHMVLGDFSTSVESYNQSLALAQSQDSALEIAQIFLGLGTAYAYQQDYPRAVSYYQQSLDSARTLGSKLGEGIALTNLGDALLKLDQLPEAASHLQQGIEVWESLRAGLGTHDDFKISLFETQLTAYRNLQEVLIAQNQPTSALEIAERGRSRAFVELLARGASQSEQTAPATVAPPSIDKIKQVAIANQATLVEYTLIREQFTETPHGQAAQYATQPQETALYIWVVKPTGEVAFRQVNLQQQALNTSLAEKVLAARQDLGIRRGGLQPSNSATNSATTGSSQAHLQEFHKLLIAPIADLLPTDPNEPIVFIPQEQLFMVPFAALQDSAGTYLIEQHTLLSAPSIQVIDLAQKIAQQQPSPPTSAGSSLIVGNPSPLPQRQAQSLADLPHAQAEANAIGQLLSAPALTGPTATEAAIKQQLSTANIIHLATHGFYDEKKPMQGALALAIADDQQDGLLTAQEISTLSLQAELAVLSACDTGLGQITGDGVVGLSRAFITAGTPSVMVSLWQVSDQATADLMIEFYQQRQQNLGNAQALRQAMLKVMETHRDPSSWSAFTLTGKIE